MKAIENCAKSVFAPVVKVDPCYDDFSRREAGVVMQSLIFAAQDGTPASSKFRYLLPQMAYALGLSGRQVTKIVKEKILPLEENEDSLFKGTLPMLSCQHEYEKKKKKKLVSESEKIFSEIFWEFCGKAFSTCSRRITDGVTRRVTGVVSTTEISTRLNVDVKTLGLLTVIDEVIDIEKENLVILRRLAYIEQKLEHSEEKIQEHPLIVFSNAEREAMEMKESASFDEEGRLIARNQLEPTENELKTTKEKLDKVIAYAGRICADVEALQKNHASTKLDLAEFLREYAVIRNEPITNHGYSPLDRYIDSNNYFGKISKKMNCLSPLSFLFMVGEGKEYHLPSGVLLTVDFLSKETRTIEGYKSISISHSAAPIYPFDTIIPSQECIDFISKLIEKHDLFLQLREEFESQLPE